MNIRFFLLFSYIFVWGIPNIASANSEEENAEFLISALNAVKMKNWISAEYNASQISDPIGLDLVTWARLRAGEGEWDEYQSFINEHQDWPGLNYLRKRSENVIPFNPSPENIRNYFATYPPQTGTGALHLARAYQEKGQFSQANQEILRAWLDLSLDKNEQNIFLMQYESLIQSKHIQRLENLLWKGWTQEASRMLPLLNSNYKKLAKARIGLKRSVKNVDELLENIPNPLTDNPGLSFDRFIWEMHKNRLNSAQDLLVKRSNPIKKQGRPKKWAPHRRIFARRAMRNGDHKLAYFIASHHGIKQGVNYADLEWLSGYLSLRYLNKPQQALIHFKNFEAAVFIPISIGRAGYWLGRTYETLDRYKSAQISYQTAAQFQTSFYGQLAAEKLSLPPNESLTGKEWAEDWRIADFAESDVMRTALLLHYAEEPWLVKVFFLHIAKSLDRSGLMQIADLALEMERPSLALSVAELAAKQGIILTRPYYPVTDLATYSADIDAEVSMAIARHESRLNEHAISPVGARGLLQIMPKTARKIAEELGIEYSKSRLLNDWRYNATLGTAYLGGLLEIYNGSYILAFTAYNAGPHLVDEWIKIYGDPRTDEIDPIDWIEHIPYRKTRNYVMRVLESLHVYRARLKGQSDIVTLSEDMHKG